MPCSSSFLTFHMVTSAVGELEMMMMGLFDLAFFAPLGCSVPSALQLYVEHETCGISYRMQAAKTIVPSCSSTQRASRAEP